MISINNFTHRLGNQLFQIATAYSLSKKNNEELLLPYWEYQYIYKLPFQVSNLKNKNNYYEPYFNYKEIQHNNVGINGYFQSEKYFEEYTDDIKYFFTPKIEIPTINSTNITSIHVRRGDYVNLQDYHCLLNIDYYENAMCYIENTKGKQMYYIFSDDINWCKINFSSLENKYNIKYIEGNEDYVDLHIMSLCENNIIANSTFSWWASWLNSNNTKIVIAPINWFGTNLKNHNTKDLYCKKWKII